MALDDYEELAARSFDEPHDLELRAAILVCADALSQIDDPRGPLIAMEHALRDADPRRAIELRRAMHEHAANHGHELLGGAASSLLWAKRTLELEWRSGRLFGVHLDARYMPRKTKSSAGALVETVLDSPAASALRRLRVRVRSDDDVQSILTALGKRTHPSPVEELDLYTNAWPARLTRTQQQVLQDKYPHLYYVVWLDRLLHLPPSGAHRDGKRDIPDILLTDPPTSVPARTFLGRAITSPDADVRGAALERITAIGPAARVYERVLWTLLQPEICGPGTVNQITARPHLPIIHALRALGPSNRVARVLEKVASRPEYYDAETRRAAGSAAAELRTV